MFASPELLDMFVKDVERRGLPAPVAKDEDHFEIFANELTVTVSLENLARDFETDRDVTRIAHFVDAIVEVLNQPVLTWEQARGGIRFAAEPADMEFGDSFHDPVTESLHRVLVHASGDESRITWLTPAHVEMWGQSREALERVAAENMDALLAQLELHIEEVDGHRLGMFQSDSAFKASLIFCPGLRRAVKTKLGWPVVAVLPNRDFLYLLPDGDSDLLGRVGSVVMDQYLDRAYPISLETFRISNAGIEALGKFAIPQSWVEDPESGMKAIIYRGGVVRFRIPEHWVEEYDEEGGGTFYDEDEEMGTLRINVLTLEATDTARAEDDKLLQLLETIERPEPGKIRRLANGNAILTYQDRSDLDEEEPTLAWCWFVAAPVPPRHARLAIFTHTVPADLADDEDILETVALLDEELRACAFSSRLGE